MATILSAMRLDSSHKGIVGNHAVGKLYLHHGLKYEVGIYHLVTFELSEVTDVFKLAALVLLCASVIVATHPYLALLRLLNWIECEELVTI